MAETVAGEELLRFPRFGRRVVGYLSATMCAGALAALSFGSPRMHPSVLIALASPLGWWLLCHRPRMQILRNEAHVTNPFRRYRVPLAEVEQVMFTQGGTLALGLRDGRRLKVWVVQKPSRRASWLIGGPRQDRIAAEIRALAGVPAVPPERDWARSR